ncbi:TolC family protein [Psychrobacter raelei]|uniref:TolC family protein n=1 Tax=Psychrobacter raelei TaxID=2565531 RepID=UPI003F62D259
MSLLKLKRSETVKPQASFVRRPCAPTSYHILTHYAKRLNRHAAYLAPLSWQLSVAVSLSALSTMGHTAPIHSGSDEYVLSPQSPIYQNPIPATNVKKIGENLDKGSYQTIPLHSIVDPASGVAIDDVYTIDVPDKISLQQAQNVLMQVSPKLASNNAGIAANELQSEATKGLNQPLIFLRAGATRYSVDADVDLTGLKSGINDSVNQAIQDNPILQNIDPNIVNAIPPTISDRLPDEYNIKRSGTNTSAGVAMLWPVYTAGRTQAVTDLADARTEESQADALLDKDDLQATLINRYFTAQLAMLAAYLREDALNTVKETDHMAQRYLEEGFISGVERLEAKTALAEAESEALKARNNAQLAMTALQRLLRSPTPIKPTSPLFVSSKPLPPLKYFQDLALKNHPGLKKVDAKYAQAESLTSLSNTGYKPTITLFGYHEIDKDPSWIAGVSASWKLWGGLDKGAQHASGQAQMRQALLAKIDVSDNILLLVEKNWQSVENARVRFQSLNSNVLLSQELLRYKQLGMKEGVNTALDVTTAQTKYLQARTEQAAAANDYVQALAALMQSIGTPEAFNEYMAVADIKLPTVY